MFSRVGEVVLVCLKTSCVLAVFCLSGLWLSFTGSGTGVLSLSYFTVCVAYGSSFTLGGTSVLSLSYFTVCVVYGRVSH